MGRVDALVGKVNAFVGRAEALAGAFGSSDAPSGRSEGPLGTTDGDFGKTELLFCIAARAAAILATSCGGVGPVALSCTASISIAPIGRFGLGGGASGPT